MKKRITLFIYILIANITVFAQEYKRSNVWAVGSQPVVTYDFTNGLIIDTVQNAGISSPPFCLISSASASVSDTNGKLLFFTNGYIVYDSNGYLMAGGFHINCPNGQVLANYYGDKSLFDQTSIILPRKDNTYYVFNTGMSDSVANNYLNHVLTEFDVLNYSVVDMDSNGGLGKVVQKNVMLADKQHFRNTSLTAVKHSNGKDWWLIKSDNNNNRYQEYLVKEDTIMGPYYQQANDSSNNAFSIGGNTQIYFSEDGSQMASGNYGTLFNNGATSNDYDFNRVDLYDFDRCNGTLTFKKYYMAPYDTSTYTNNDYKQGICFSPNGKLLYMSTIYNIYQVDLEDTNTNNALFIHGPDTTISNFPWYGTMGIAPNGNIYIGNGNGTRKYMSFIDSPDVKGLGCHFVPQGVWQPYTNLMSPPNMPNYGLGADTSVICWPLGSNEIIDQYNEITVYPNPANSKVYIKYSNTPKRKIELYNKIGQLLLTTWNIEMDVSAYPSVENNFYRVQTKGLAALRDKDVWRNLI